MEAPGLLGFRGCLGGPLGVVRLWLSVGFWDRGFGMRVSGLGEFWGLRLWLSVGFRDKGWDLWVLGLCRSVHEGNFCGEVQNLPKALKP